jgi:hypothetical protein
MLENHKHTQKTMIQTICGSCQTTIDLDLKFLVHMANDKSKNIIKLWKRSHKIHRLLKNQCTSEYILFTEKCIRCIRTI